MIATLAVLLAVVTAPYAPVSYACDGTTANFTVTFPFQSSSNLVVTSTTTGGTITSLALTSDYTVNVTSTQSTAVLTLTSPSTKCQAGSTLKISRSTPLTQPTGFRQQTVFSPPTHETALDRIAMQAGEIGVNLSALTTKEAADFLAALNPTPTTVNNASSVQIDGTNSVSQTLQAVISNVYTLKNFGAPCDGSTDDSAALGKAITALPSNGGVIDARACRTGMALNAMSITKNGVTILLPSATIKLNGYLDVLAFGVHLVGAGISTTFSAESTTIQVATTAGIRFGAVGTPVWNWSAEKMTLTPQAAATPSFGIQLFNARQGFLDHVAPSGFSAANAAGVLQLDNCWSNRYVEVQVISNDLGFAYEGTQANADIHIGGMYSSNRIGVYVALGGGVASSSGIYMLGSPQFEGNTDTGIKLVSGSIQGFHLWGGYGELLSGAKRFLTAQSDTVNTLRLAYLDVAGTSVLAQGTLNPVLLDSTQTVNDFINAHIEMLGYDMTGGATALVDAVGASTNARVDGKALGVSSIVPLHTATAGAKVVSVWFDGSGLNFRNNADSGMNVAIDSGATVGQSSVLVFKDRGVTKNAITSVGGSLFINDSTGGLNKIILNQSNNPTNINSQGGNGVQINATTNAGTTGLEVWNGGATPAKIITIGGTNGAGVATLVAGTVTATVPTGCRAICTDTTAAAAIRCSVSGTTLTLTGTGTDVINYFCY